MTISGMVETHTLKMMNLPSRTLLSTEEAKIFAKLSGRNQNTWHKSARDKDSENSEDKKQNNNKQLYVRIVRKVFIEVEVLQVNHKGNRGFQTDKG